jgi:hypothetical protein
MGIALYIYVCTDIVSWWGGVSQQYNQMLEERDIKLDLVILLRR